jgi:hypothetical protein
MSTAGFVCVSAEEGRGQKFCAVTQISGTFFRGYLLDTESF